MSLRIKLNNTVLWDEYVWYVGQPVDNIVNHGHTAHERICFSVYADGDEHERVVQSFPNLVHGHGSTKWTGPFAQFIFDNFSNLKG